MIGWGLNGGTKKSLGFLEIAGGFCLTGELWELCGELCNASFSFPFKRKQFSSSGFPLKTAQSGVSSVILQSNDNSSRNFDTGDGEELRESSSGEKLNRVNIVGSSWE